MDHDGRFGLILLAVLVGGPLILGIVGWVRSPKAEEDPARLPGGRLIALSTLIYVLAFNLTFFIQELFLVVPKALTPGLRPTLYHNNHNWDGSHPLESLFQGTGALAILISGTIFALLAARGAGRTIGARLFVLWMAYHGLFQSLPQVAFAPVAPGSDTGQALDYFGLSLPAEWAIGAIAAAAIVAMGLFMAHRFAELAPSSAGRFRTNFVFRAAVLPAILAIPLLILFRVPREWVEVVMPTIAVPLIGLSWVQAAAWRSRGPAAPPPPADRIDLRRPALAALILLAFFQLVLRPGIAFY